MPKAALGLALALLQACASLPARKVDELDVRVTKALTEGTLRVVSPLGFAHGCAIVYGDRTLILTNRHVVDPLPLQRDAATVGVSWSDDLGGEGLARPLFVDAYRDLAVLEIVRGTPGRVFTLAQEAPKPGDLTWALGYDFSSRQKALGPKVVKAAVVRAIAGCLVLEKDADRGSSGSCVLDAQERVPAIDAWAVAVGFKDTDRVAVVVGLWGAWFALPEEKVER